MMTINYMLSPEVGTIVRLNDNTYIPADPRNRDYVEYLAWKDAGNEPEPFAPPTLPAVDNIHMAWFRAALAEAGKLVAVDAAVASLGPVRQALWEYATSIRIDDPDVIAVANILDVDLRATFDRAAAIRSGRHNAG